MRCGQCGTLLEEEDRFCGDCGTPVVGGCPSCGEPVAPGKRFCRACGTAVSPAEPVTPAETGPAPVAERRVCSVLFCDLVGFTPLSEARDPEAVRELLSRYFDTARTVIGRYGGVVEKFIGDAVMAVWGTPVATEGDAERAVRAALDLVAAVAVLGSETGVPELAARAGLVTGEVAVTIGAVSEGMVAGDAVNTAARVQAAAGAGQVLADGSTQRLAASAVEFADAGEHELKGKAETQRLWRATRVLSAVGGAQRVDGLEAPLTGRDAELRTVRELFHAAAGRRVPRLVLVSGPAGVGKSRLGWEFEKYIDGLAGNVWWHRGRCLSYGEGIAFWALAEIVRQRLGIAEEDPAAVAGDKLAAGLDRFVPDPAERSYVGTRLGRLLGVAAAGDDGSELSQAELFAGWRLFFERLAAELPVVLLVEDAQHADAGLLDFLDHLVDWSRDLPFYVLVFARPELDQARPGFGTGRNRVTLTLDPLDPVSMDALVDALVPGMAEPARASITAHAQGIPLFAVETVRSLIDQDIVQPVEGTYRLTGDIGELAVPDSLHALLAARLDALDPAVRRLVTEAAVLGGTFPAAALIAVSSQDEPAVRDGLADLLRRELLTVSADPLSPEQGSYAFAQHLLRQVAYDTLSRRDRKARHLAVAEHLRQAFPGDGEEVADAVAQHYLDAWQAVPEDPDAGRIRGQAVAALIRAAERAERTGAPGRAMVNYATAADLQEEQGRGDDAPAPNGLDAGLLWERAANAATINADFAVAIQYASRAGEYHRRSHQARPTARAQALVGNALRLAGRHTEAREQLTAAVSVLRDAPDTDTVQALEQLAMLEVTAGTATAGGITDEALTLGQSLAVGPSLLCALLNARGIHFVNLDRQIEAVAYFRAGAQLAAQADDSLARGRSLANLAFGMSVTDPAAAAQAGREAVSCLRRAGARDNLAFSIINLAGALLLLGDWGGAETECTRADAGGLENHEIIVAQRGWQAAMRGEITAAEAALAAVPDLRASEDASDQVSVTVGEAFLADAQGRPQDALQQARSIVDRADTIGVSHDLIRWAWPLATRAAGELGDGAAIDDLLTLLDSQPPGKLGPMLRAERELVRARRAARAGDRDALAAAVAGVRAHSTPYHLAHARLDEAEQLAGHGDPDGAAEAVAEARAIAERLRCQPLLDRAGAFDAERSRTRAG